MTELGYRDVRVVAKAKHRQNVIGEVGQGQPSLILNAHLDTKPPGNEEDWETPPYAAALRDGRLFGLGATDMKGAAAAMIHAAAALADAVELGGTVKVVLTADEEAGSAFGARYLAETGAVAADAALIGEPAGVSSAWEFLAVASRGISCFSVTVRGTQMHSSLSDRIPSVNASVKLARVIIRLADELALPEGAALNLGVTLGGGVYYGICPGEAECGVDVRTVPGMTLAALQAEVETFLETLRREDAELQVSAAWHPVLTWHSPCAIDPGHPLVTAAAGAAQTVLGHEVPLGVMPAFTDATNWSGAGIPSIPAFGPGLLTLAHRPNEYVKVAEVVEASQIYALTALHYIAARRDPERAATS